MSFWNILKSAAISAKCMSGIHGGTYTHAEGQPECHLEKTCPDCGSNVTKEKHNFSDWTHPSPVDCNAKRVCKYCEKDEFKVIHQYERFKKDPENCEVIMRCARCNEEKRGEPEHEWLSLFNTEISINTSEGKKKKCRKCGALG